MNDFSEQLGIALPVIGGPMYPCSNPELVASVSQAGGIGVVQPISLTYVHGYDFREGLRYIRSLTDKPVGMNVLIEQSSRRYRARMERWIDIALEEGLRFFITSLGKPDWVVRRVHGAGGRVYHDVTERKWAEKGLACGVDGLIAVNDRAGGHAGAKSPQQLLQELADFDVPLICAGGVSTADDFVRALDMGYAGVQMGTRFIATPECKVSEGYKRAIVEAQAQDVVLTSRITGIPVAVLRTPYVARSGTEAGLLARWLLGGARTRHWMRTLYALKSLRDLKAGSRKQSGRDDYWQAGKSVAGIDAVEPVAVILQRFAAAHRQLYKR
jgi:nitronate monooxygenase